MSLAILTQEQKAAVLDLISIADDYHGQMEKAVLLSDDPDELQAWKVDGSRIEAIRTLFLR